MTQDQTFKILKSKKNVFLTGSAGTGKTHTIKKYISTLSPSSVAVVAPTGIAALNIEGRTIHSLFKLPPTLINFDEWEINISRDRKKIASIKMEILKIRTLIIDEVSMVHSLMLELINDIMKWANRNDKPFGGVQVVVVGDFFQLEPIHRPREENHYLYDPKWEERADLNKFAWRAKAWKEANFVTCYLTEKYRQENTDPLVEILDAIRGNNITPRVIELLENMKMESDKDTVKLYTRNINVDIENNRRLKKIDSKEEVHIAKETGKEYLINNIYKNTLWRQTLTLKIGALVMFIVNDTMKRFVNGSIGRVIAYQGGYPVVELENGDKIHAIPQEFKLKKGNETLAKIEQIPLTLAWAITVHKSQGLTITSLEIDLSDVFTYGMGYVALSRGTHYKGINLVGYSPMALQVNPYTLKIDPYMLRASSEAERGLDG